MPFPVGEQDVAAAEAALGGRLPAMLRIRLMRDNGGIVSTADDDFELFKILDTFDPKRAARTSARDIVRENASMRQWPGFPQDAVAIADNGSGDVLVIVAIEGSYGETVFRWEHETAELTEVGDLGVLTQ